MSDISHYTSHMKSFFQNRKNQTILLSLVIVISVILLYLSVFNNPFVWDDMYGVAKNKYVHDIRSFLYFFSDNTYSGSGSIGANWRPLMLTVFSIIWKFWGGWVIPYHVVSIFLHATNAVLVFILLNRLFGKYWVAFLTALVFAVHPLQTQAIVYIAGLGDPLSAFFILVGVITYLKAKDNDKETRIFIILSWLCFMCALLSKENAVMMPGLLLIADFFSRNKEEGFKANLYLSLKKLLPFAILFAFYILARLTFLNFLSNVFESSFSIPFYERALVFFTTICVYFRLIFAPLHLHMEYTFYWVHSLFEIKALIGFAIITGFLTAIITQWKKRPAVSFGLAWFLIAYSPNANLFMPTTNLFGEHWLYLSLIGFFIAIFSLGEELVKKGKFLLVALFLLFTWIGWISSVTIDRNQDWETPVSILSQTVKEEPKKVMVRIVLASVYRDQGEYTKALENYAEAMRLEPYNYLVYSERALLYKKTGETDKMVADMETSCQNDAIRSPSFKPLMSYYQKHKEFEKAEKMLLLSLSQKGTPEIKLGTTIQLIANAVQKKDKTLVKKYLGMADQYEKEIQNNWVTKLDLWLMNKD